MVRTTARGTLNAESPSARIAAPVSFRLRRTALPVALLTFAFILAGFGFALAAPLFQAPDEPPHIDMVRHRIHHPLSLPGSDLRIRQGVEAAVEQVGLNQGGPVDWTKAPADRPAYPRFADFPNAEDPATTCHVGTWTSCQNYHYGHPPTYYALVSPVAAVLERFSFPVELLGLRLLGVLLVAPMVPLTAYAAAQVWPDAPRRPVAAAAVVALFAPLAANAAAVNNDALDLLCAAAAIALAARLLRRPHPGTAFALGAATGAGLLVKSDFLALAAVAALAVAVVLPSLRRQERVRTVAGFVVPALVGSVWYLRNLIRYGGLGQPGTEILRPVEPGPWNAVTPLRFAIHHFDDLLGRVWGLYGQTAVDLPTGWIRALNLAFAALVVGWLLCRRWTLPGMRSLRLAVLAGFPAALTAGALAASFSVFRSNGEVRGLLGRYVYPGLPVLGIAAVAATAAIADRLVPRLRGRATVGVVVLAGLTVASFVRAGHGFYGTRSAALALHRADIVSAVPSVGSWLAPLAVLWVLAVAGCAVLLYRDRSPSPAQRPAG
jgi:hypothetical protein